MKRLVIVPFVMLWTVLPALADGPLWGDLNGDGVVTAVDISMAVNDIVEGQYWVEHDLNEDGEVNASDLSTIINIAAGYDHEQRVTAFQPSGTLPVLHIDTEGYVAVTSKDEYVRGTYWLDPCDLPDVQALGSEAKPLALQIKGRGNWSWTQKKKPYRLKLDKKAAVLGMNSNKHWTLLAHVSAPLKNTMGFELGRMLGMPYVPAERPVEVVMNGRYVGIYWITEKIRIDKDRVNIVEQDDEETDPAMITGGWLLEISNKIEENQIEIPSPGQKLPMRVTVERPEVMSAEQLGYITDRLWQMHNAIYKSKSPNEMWRIIDLESFARFYMVQEILCNVEAFSGSCYFYKDRGEDARFMFGPLWDMESAFYTGAEGTTSLIHEKYPSIFASHLIGKCYQSPHLRKTMTLMWRKFYPEQAEAFMEFVGTMADPVRKAMECDKLRWPEYNGNSVDVSVKYYKRWLRAKLDYLDLRWQRMVSHPDPNPLPDDGQADGSLIDVPVRPVAR